MKTAGLFFFVAGLALVAAGVVLGEEPRREKVVRSVPERMNGSRQPDPALRKETANATPVRKDIVQSGTAHPLRD